MALDGMVLEAIGEYAGLNEEGVAQYYRAKQRIISFSSIIVINPFKNALKASTGYNEENIPTEEVETVRDFRDVSFKIKTTPTTKRPSYEGIYSSLNGYLEYLKDQYLNRVRRGGVITIDDTPYVALDVILDRVQEEVLESKVPTVKQEVKPLGKGGLEREVVRMVSVPLVDYSVLNDENAFVYFRVEKLHDDTKARIVKEFERELEDSTGYSKQNIPSRSDIKYRQMGEHLFSVHIIPYDNISYASIINSLIKEEKKTEKSGDLILIDRGIQHERLEGYNLRVRESRKFISLDALMTKLIDLKKVNTKRDVRFKINHFPLI